MSLSISPPWGKKATVSACSDWSDEAQRCIMEVEKAEDERLAFTSTEDRPSFPTLQASVLWLVPSAQPTS
jgi:hypothetical protein